MRLIVLMAHNPLSRRNISKARKPKARPDPDDNKHFLKMIVKDIFCRRYFIINLAFVTWIYWILTEIDIFDIIL